MGTITSTGYSGNANTLTDGVYVTSSVIILKDISNAGSGENIKGSETIKLSDIEALADVTDAGNVTAAGAIMNTGNQSTSGIKTFNDKCCFYWYRFWY